MALQIIKKKKNKKKKGIKNKRKTMDQRHSSFGICDTDFWVNLENLRKTLEIISNSDIKNDFSVSLLHNSGNHSRMDENADLENSNENCISKEQIMKKINKLFGDFIQRRENKENATIAVPNRKLWKNTCFEKNKGIQLIKNPVLRTVGKGVPAVASKRLVLFQHLLTKIYKLIETDSYKTKRELYYEDVAFYKSQKTVDSILDDISCLLNVSKIHLHVLTTPKGCIAGKLRFKDADGNYIDCSETARGILVPSNVQSISNIQSDARFILVIEKSAVYEMLVDNDITSLFHPCIIMTGKGFPDINTREILKKLWDNLRIPVLGLFDADPYGIEILGTYKYGSRAMAFDVKNLAVPEMRWLGLLPTDIQRLNLPPESIIPLTENDVKKAQYLLNLPYIQHHVQWRNEVQVMMEMKKKAEIEGLSKLDPYFLPSIYLPNKIKYGGWI